MQAPRLTRRWRQSTSLFVPSPYALLNIAKNLIQDQLHGSELCLRLYCCSSIWSLIWLIRSWDKNMPTSCKRENKDEHLAAARSSVYALIAPLCTSGIASPSAMPPSMNMLLWIKSTSTSMQPLVWIFLPASPNSRSCMPWPHMVLTTLCTERNPYV